MILVHDKKIVVLARKIVHAMMIAVKIIAHVKMIAGAKTIATTIVVAKMIVTIAVVRMIVVVRIIVDAKIIMKIVPAAMMMSVVATTTDEGMTNRPPIFAYLVFGPGKASRERLSRPIKVVAWRGPGAILGVQARFRGVQVRLDLG
jgi:hypothetical protein